MNPEACCIAGLAAIPFIVHPIDEVRVSESDFMHMHAYACPCIQVDKTMAACWWIVDVRLHSLKSRDASVNACQSILNRAAPQLW